MVKNSQRYLPLSVAIFLSFAFMGLTFWSGAKADSPPPVSLGNFSSRIDTWTMDVPGTVFGFDKLGVRRGGYTLHLNLNGRLADIQIYPRNLTKVKDSKDMFAKWKAEDELRDIATKHLGSPIVLDYSAEGDGLVTVTGIKVAQANEAPAASADGERYLMSGKTPVESKDQIFVDMETITILTIFLALVVPPYAVMLLTKSNFQKLGQ